MFNHLFTQTVQDTIDTEGYGAWRSISAPDAVSLSFGFPYPTSFPNGELLSVARAVFEDEGDVALQYTGGKYADQLDKIVADRAGQRGINCDANQVVLTNGATHAIDVVCRTFIEPGEPIFVEAPTFMGALHLFESYGAAVTGLPLDNDGLNVEAVANELTKRRASGDPLPKLFYTIPTFHNPTGITLPIDRRERLLELAEEYDFIVLEDDAYGMLRYDSEPVPSLKALDQTGRVVRVSTFSKTIAPGVRTGWVIADKEIAEQVDRMNAGGTNTFTQGIISRYCSEGYFDENVAELRQTYERRRDVMLDRLAAYMPKAVEWTEPKGGFFIWVTLPAGLDSSEMLATAAEKGVVYLPGDQFFNEDQGAHNLRLSFSHASLDEIDRGIKALASASKEAFETR